MHNVTQNFLNTIKLPNRGFKSTVKIRDTIFDDTNIIDMSLEENVNPADSFMLGSVASNKLEVTLIDVPNILILENAIVNPKLSLLVGSNYEEVPLGVFTVDEISKDKSTVKLTCFDNMIKLERAYFSNLSYPSSINSVAQEICSKTGVQLATTLPSTLINKIEGYTYREAISFIASFLGGFARFNRLGKLEIVSYGTTNIEVTGDNYFKLNTSEKAFTIGRLTCQVGENIISVGASGNEIKFENPIMTQVQLNNIFNNLKVLSYMPYSMDWQGNPALMAGDKIKIIDVKGNTYNTLLMQQKLSYKGGLSSTSKAVGKTEQAQEFSSNGSMKNKVERVVIEQANIKLALIEKATIEDLTVVNARIDNLYTTDLKVVNAKITNLEVYKADVIKLNAETARINDLYAKKADIIDLTALSGKINILETKVGTIDTILSKEIFVELATAGKIVAGSSIIAEGAIGSAQISSLSATKLSAGIIDAAVITVKNLNADNITVGSINGQRIANGAIDNSKVANNANISGSKLNINDVIVHINGATTQINSTKIQVGDRTLDLELSTQKISLEENKTNISKQQATITAMDSAIKLKVDNQTFNTFKATTEGNISTVNTTLTKATSSIDVLQKSIALKVSQAEIDKSINDLAFSVRNLLLDSGIRSESIDYNIKKYKLSTKIANGTTVTISIKGSLGNGKSCFGIYNSGGSLSVAQLFPGDLNSDGVYTKTFKWTVGATTNTELWIYQIPSGVVASSTIEWTTLVEGNKAPKDWIPAPEDTDQAISKVDTKINTKVGEINLTLDGITSRVGKTESASTVIDGKVTALSTRVSNAEQKITPESITTSVRNSTAYKTDMNGKASTTDLQTAQSSIQILSNQIANKVDVNGVISTVTQNAGSIITNFSKTGEVIIKNGNFSIENSTGGKMFWVQGGKINAAALDLYAEADGTMKIYGPGAKGVQLISNNDKEIYIDFKRSGTAPYNGRISMPKANQMQYICDSHYFGGPSAVTTLTVQGQILSETSIYAKERIEGHSFHAHSGYITANKALWFTDPTFSAVQDINVRTAIHHGAKTALVDTKSYGKTFVYAEEGPTPTFVDYGGGIIGEDGLCYIYLDPQFAETISTNDCDYWIQLTGWTGCNAEIKGKQADYFVVSGNPNKKFEWKAIGERKGYERLRFNEAMEANNILS